MTISRVQGNARGTTTAGTMSITLAQTPTNGNALIATFGTGWSNSGGKVASVTSIVQTGVTWTKQTGVIKTNFIGSEIWFGIVGSGASTAITVNLDAAPNYGAIGNVCEYSGLATTGVLDKTASSTGLSTASSTGTTATTTQPNELWIGSTGGYGGGHAPQTTPTNGFTLFDGVLYTTVTDAFLEKIVSATGAAYSGTAFQANAHWAGCIATFKASGGMPVLRVRKGTQTHNLRVVSNGSGHSGMGGIPKIASGGQVYDVYLVETTDPTASPVRVKTTSQVVKAIQCAETCQVSQTCQTCDTCQTACELSCQTCQPCVTCQDTCQITCQPCQTTCQITCQPCQTTCETTCQPCQTTCQITCQPCQVGCEVSCQDMCVFGCQACESSCDVTCQNCQTSCQVSCQTTCDTACQTACEVSCQASCYLCYYCYGCLYCEDVGYW